MESDQNGGPGSRGRGDAYITVEPDQGLISFRKSKALATERDFPHIVEIVVPVNGLDVRLNREMATFHRSHNIRPRFGQRRTQIDQHYCRWCFSDPAIADAFCERFGGERVMNRP